MRSKQEIAQASKEADGSDVMDALKVEVLLDIRELLQKLVAKKKPKRKDKE